MLKIRITALVVLLAGILIGYFVYTSEQGGFGGRFPFRLGLDLAGGTHLVYRADTSLLAPGDVQDSMEALRDVIERRVNLFGVAEPVVQVEKTAGIISEHKDERLVIELPGVTDVDEAVAMIGQTPLLEFRLEVPDSPMRDAIIEGLENAPEEIDIALLNSLYEPTQLTGRYLSRSSLAFDSLTGEPRVVLNFDSEGDEIFRAITKENVGKFLAIYLDGAPISIPVIREEITGGQAEISGGFTPEEAKLLVGRLNSGALPVPIELLSTQTVGAALGEEAQARGVRAGFIGLLVVALFMICWYRLPGVVAVISLGAYIAAMLALFKLIPVTLTASGIAAFILSIGMAVDANVLIFERLKEELKEKESIQEAVLEGFKRAWIAIRDSNLSSLITAVILFWFGTSSVEGFALVFGFGVLLSMITAVSISRTILLAISSEKSGGIKKFLFGNGIK